MGKSQRDKGARGEREAVKELGKYGIAAVRTAPMQAGAAGQFGDIAIKQQCDLFMPWLRVEVKRQERASVDAWLNECQSHGSPEALVMYRRNQGEWRVCLSLSDLITMMRSAEYAAFRQRFENGDES
jgi:Holliday junction resolvase